MPFYLTEYQGSGTRQDPFRPIGSDQPGASAIDLRPDPSLLDGGGLNAALLRVPLAFADPAARFLADDKLEQLTNPQKNFLENRLGVDLSSPTLLRDIIATILTAPPANGWKALRPGRLRWEIWLGELIWEAPRASGGATDDFNRANETPLAGNWVQLAGSGTTLNLSSNGVIAAAAANAIYYYSGAAVTSDQYSAVKNTADGFRFAGPVVRVGSNGFSGYGYDAAFEQPWKFVAGSITLIGSTQSPTPNANDLMRIEAEGSSISTSLNGSELTGSPVTDTSLTTAGDGVGIIIGELGAVLDDWEGGDLGVVPPEVTYGGSPRHGLLGVS